MSTNKTNAVAAINLDALQAKLDELKNAQAAIRKQMKVVKGGDALKTRLTATAARLGRSFMEVANDLKQVDASFDPIHFIQNLPSLSDEEKKAIEEKRAAAKAKREARKAKKAEPAPATDAKAEGDKPATDKPATATTGRNGRNRKAATDTLPTPPVAAAATTRRGRK